MRCPAPTPRWQWPITWPQAMDAGVTNLLANLVVIIDPLMNPDGRDRFLAMQAQNRTVQPSVDDQSLLHTGEWP